MARMQLARIVFVTVLGWGVSQGLARAQSPGPFPRTPPGATELPPGVPPVDSSRVPNPVREYFRTGRPLGCWGTFNGFGCGSLHSELGFVFGSSRTFFGEPCLKGAPPSSLPPWAGPASSYGPNSRWAYATGYGVGTGAGAGADATGAAAGVEQAGGEGKRGLFGRLFKKKCSTCTN